MNDIVGTIIGGLFAGGLFLLPIGVIGGVIYWQVKKNREFGEAFKNDAEYTCTPPSFLARPIVTTRRAALPTKLEVASTGGKNSIPLWHIWVSGIALSERTTLTLGSEGFFSGLRDAIGLSDIKIGVASFDDAYAIRGSDDAVVRGVLRRGDVADAVNQLFREGSVRSLALRADGVLFADLRRSDLTADEARRVLRLVRGLADRLHAAAHVEAVELDGRAKVPKLGHASVSSSSGSPFVVPALKD